MYTITKSEFNKLTKYIKKYYGIHIKEEKLSLVTGRLSNELIKYKIDNFSDYYSYVISDVTGEAARELINKITTNHTYFMRESDHFDYFRQIILPYLRKTVKEKDLRIWSAGCSTGEEAYTLAMILDENLGEEKVLWDSKVLATDICSEALKKAAEGIYGNEEIKILPVLWRQHYFERYDNQNVIICPKLKKEIIFRKLNFMDRSFPFKKKFHVIFCRNVMIYFDNNTKCELVNKFYDQLEDGGYLFIGHSEALNREKTKFKYIMPAIYRKE